MTGIAQAIGEAAEKVAPELYDDIKVSAEAPTWYRTTEALWNKSKFVREKFTPYIKNEWEPDLARELAVQRARQGNLNPLQMSGVKDYMMKVHNLNGRQGIVANTIIQAHRELGPVYANQFADSIDTYLHAYGFPSYRTGARDVIGDRIKNMSSYTPTTTTENRIKNAASWAFTGHIVLPHMTQPLNELMNAGLHPIIEATHELLRNPHTAFDNVALTGALEHEIAYSARLGAMDAWPRTIRTLFFQPGFNWVRKWQIVHSALVGKYSALEIANKILHSPDTVTQEDKSILQLLGLNHEHILNQGTITPEQIQTAMYRSADTNMFINRERNLPYKWVQNPVMRIATLYKFWPTSQGRMVIESIKRNGMIALKDKNPLPFIKTLATLGVLFPIAGEFMKYAQLGMTHPTEAISDPMALIHKEQKQEPFYGVMPDKYSAEYIDALAHTAGIGVLYSMLRGARRRQLYQFATGPVIGTALDITNDAIYIKFAKDKEKAMKRVGWDIASRFPVVGGTIKNVVKNTHTHSIPSGRTF